MDRSGLLECGEKRITILDKLVTNEKENIRVFFFFVGMTSVFLDNVVCPEATGRP